MHGSREVSSFSEASGNPERTIYMSIVIIGGNERMVCQYTVSHKMVISASQEAKKNNIPVARIHTSSASALKCALDEHAVMA